MRPRAMVVIMATLLKRRGLTSGSFRLLADAWLATVQPYRSHAWFLLSFGKTLWDVRGGTGA